MAVTCGFYNALNHDRLYDAIQMSSIFDGIIQDGVFSTIGDSLIVTSPEDGMYVDVGPGRAWFNHSWTLNDTEYPVEAEEAEVVLDRIDAVVLEVNANPEVRNNRIYFVKGTPSSNPVKPTLIHNAEVNQYALAYVTIRAGQTTIFQSDIENVVGTDETPFVTGLLQQVSVEQLLLQWNDDFYRYFAAFQSHNNAEFNTWMEAKVAEYNAWYAAMEEEGAHDLETFDTWFQHMKDQLDEDAAGHLQQEIDELAEACEKGSVFTVSTEEPELVGRSCVISQGLESVTKQFDANGVALFPSMPYIGNIHVEATDGDNVAQGEMTIPYFGRYSMSIAFWAATLNISTSADGLIERPITITKGGVVVGTTSFNASGRATYKVHEPGTYIVSSSTAGGDEYSATVVVTEETAYPVNLGIPSGATAMPTDDIQIWLKCASIYDKSYTLLNDVLEDYYTCERLFSDSNACDYMARSSSWAAIVTTDASVMEQIGKYDYCCKKLMSNVIWATAICASDYTDYVIPYDSGLIPKMTSNTAPSGEATGTTYYGAGYEYYKAFDHANTSSNYWCTAYNTTSGYVQYGFTSPVTIKAARISFNNNVFADQVVLRGHDGTNWVNLATIDTSAHNKDYYITLPNNEIAYRYYSALCSIPSGSYVGIAELQLWGEEVRTDLIHSAANDTVYYYDSNNVERQLCVTDANGNGTVDWSEMEPGIYTFYSTVSKNPDNLSEEYSRTVKITKTTTEIYLMPPNALYWYGFEAEEMTLVNTGGSYLEGVITKNPNSINLQTALYNAIRNFAYVTKRWINGLNAKAIINKGTLPAYSGACVIQWELYDDSYIGAILVYAAGDAINTPTKKISNEINRRGQVGFVLQSNFNNARTILEYAALWRDSQRSITVHSAANDTIYYLGENNVHIPFAKTDETGTASVDLGLIPQGTYTLYSSVAKDPDNLSNPYSKTITIGPDTKSIKVMPDGALYWYGWHVDLVAAQFKLSSNWASCNGDLTFNEHYVQIHATSSGAGSYGFRTVNPIATTSQNKIKGHYFDSTGSSYTVYAAAKQNVSSDLVEGNYYSSGNASSGPLELPCPTGDTYVYVTKRGDGGNFYAKLDWLFIE